MDLPVAKAGYLGVDLFFLLSGFVLSHAHPTTRWTWSIYRAFIRARFARIFPMHWAALLLIALTLVIYPGVYAAMPQRFQLVDLLTSTFLIQNWGFGPLLPWNGPAWSLSTEWLVSLAFPLFLLGARRVARPSIAAFLCAAAIGVFAVFLVLTHNPDPGVTARAGIIRTVCEFGAGCLLYRVYTAGARANVLTYVAAAALVGAGVLVPWLAILAVFGFALVVFLAAQNTGPVARLLSSRVMVFLGDISFSVYLVHWILLQVSDRVEKAFNVDGVWAFFWFCGYLALVLALSTTTYKLIERPAQRWLRGPAAASRTALKPLEA
jgi:peptidoglycan/LPS O-acetylase OafA/YrhL